MADARIELHSFQFNLFRAGIDLAIEEAVLQDEFEYNHMGVTFSGITPRMKVNLRPRLDAEFELLFGNTHPRVKDRLIEELLQFLDASLVGLFSVRERGVIEQHEIRRFLSVVVSSLFDMTKWPTFLGNYVKILDGDGEDNID